MSMTPLDSWILKKTGAPDVFALYLYQLEKFRETLAYAKTSSRFYSKHLSDIEPDSISGLQDISHIPFTTPEMLIESPVDFVCVPPSEISRIVTLRTSGTAGPSKRVFFTQDDQELTLDFFHHGMTTLANESDKVMIFLPGKSEGSVGKLLCLALERFGCEGIVHGQIDDYEAARHALVSSGCTCAVGLPAQLLALSSLCPEIRLKSVLLCSDYISKAVTSALEETWDCEVFGHYGMTETGLGGGVECSGHAGYHLREADLLFEVVDPSSGAPIPEGERGELVFTTLTRRGMPLIRYMTGDLSSIISGRCPCGSALRRIGRVFGRAYDMIDIDGKFKLSMPMLDELLFDVPGLVGFTAGIAPFEKGCTLVIKIYATNGAKAISDAQARILSDPDLGAPISAGLIKLRLQQCGPEILPYGNVKRIIRQDAGL